MASNAPALSQRGRISVLQLSGTAEQIGRAHGALLRERILEIDRVLWALFDQHLPRRWVRWLVLRLARFRYRRLEPNLAPERTVELHATARALQPDPLEREFSTYDRLCFLSALYDIALSFERSPLVGCTSFAVNGEMLSRAGSSARGALLARAFDFDAHPIFDHDKVVFLVNQPGKIAFASVAWPGLVGVVSGMNLQGLAVVVHGARAGKPSSVGEPVVHSLRRALESANTVEQAIEVIDAQPPLISHLVVLADARGITACLERVPGKKSHLRPLGPRAAVTNHFVGPCASDPRNLFIRATTSTVERADRADELLGGAARFDVSMAIDWLRDRRAPGGAALADGDRRAIDAGIATHGVVFETGERKLWVSEGPHLTGRFIEFRLAELFGETAEAAPNPEFGVIPARQ